MSIAIRVAIVLAIVLVVIVVARLAGRWQRPSHPALELVWLNADPGIVLFTSTDCANCNEALAVAESLAVPIRLVAWELEPAMFERVGVEAVPLTVVVNRDGEIELMATGVPSRRRLQRGIERAGVHG